MLRSPVRLRLAPALLLPFLFPAVIGAAERTPEATPAVTTLCTELIDNGGFERTDAAGQPIGWRGEVGAYTGVTIDLAKGGGARAGARALRIKSTTSPVLIACFNRPIEAAALAGKEAVVSCFYRTVDAPLADIGLLTYEQPFDGWRTPFLTAERRPLEPSPRWRLASWRVRVPAQAQEAVFVIRAAGAGEAVFDDVSVRPSVGPVGMDVLSLGQVIGLPAHREVRVEVSNESGLERSLRLTVEAEHGKAVARRTVTLRAPAHGRAQTSVAYDMPADAEHSVALALEDPLTGSVCSTLVDTAPGLLTARVVDPAFRGTVLNTVPTEGIVVEGQINASEALGRELALEADLGGAGRIARDGDGITRLEGGRWRLALGPRRLLRGRYPLTITALRGGRVAGSVVVQIARAQDAPHEAGYDTRGRLYVDGKPVFANGLYNVTDEAGVAKAAAQGFNLAVIPSTSASMDLMGQAEKAGLMVTVYSPNPPVAGQTADLSFWEHAARKYAASPAVIGWHLQSRPDAALMPPGVFRAQQEAMWQIDDHHPTLTLLSVPSLLPAFAPWCDILAFESQPVPAMPLESMVEDLKQAQHAAVPGRPVWAAIQSVGRAWLHLGGGVEEEGAGRAPTGGEHRAMTFLALTHGAQGLLHHGYYFSGRGEREPYYLPQAAPDLWEAMKGTNALVSRLAPALVGGAYRGVEVTGPVHVGAWDFEGRVYVAAINVQSNPALTTFTVPGAAPTALCPVEGGDPLPKTEAGRFVDELPAYGAKVYVGEAAAEAAETGPG